MVATASARSVTGSVTDPGRRDRSVPVLLASGHFPDPLSDQCPFPFSDRSDRLVRSITSLLNSTTVTWPFACYGD
jgi:hypothetical protein